MKKQISYIYIFSVLFSLVTVSCGPEAKKEKAKEEVKNELPPIPEFNTDSAYAFVKAQCDFGPRVPNTKAHEQCGDYLIAKMNTWCDTVIVQKGVVEAFDGTRLRFRNIIASFNPSATRRILLFAHWDTRPWADQDTFDTDKPVLGADDGASGVGVLMETARQLHTLRVSYGIDIIFFDAEDYGKAGGGPGSEDSYALGTQYWTKQPHVPGYKADYGILLDMVGAHGARFLHEGLSKQQAGFVIERVWQIAHRLGYSSYFIYEDGGWITDDHVYVNRAGIPAIDIINTQPGSPTGFAPHWHTHRDNMDIIDKRTLRAVGHTLLGVLYREESL